MYGGDYRIFNLCDSGINWKSVCTAYQTCDDNSTDKSLIFRHIPTQNCFLLFYTKSLQENWTNDKSHWHSVIKQIWPSDIDLASILVKNKTLFGEVLYLQVKNFLLFKKLKKKFKNQKIEVMEAQERTLGKLKKKMKNHFPQPWIFIQILFFECVFQAQHLAVALIFFLCCQDLCHRSHRHTKRSQKEEDEKKV